MFRTTVRNLLTHKLRLALSALAIVLGVAFVAGTMIFTDTLNKTFTDIIDSGTADVDVAPKSAFDSGLVGTGVSSAQSSVPASVLDDITAVDGVEAAEGYVQTEGIYVLDSEGEVLETNGAPGLGVGWITDRSLSQSELTDGRAPSAEGEVALDAATAEKLDYQVGDQVALLTTGPRIEATLVGVFQYGESGNLAGATMAAFDTTTAQELFLEPGRYTGVSVNADDGVSQIELDEALSAALGDKYDVRTRAEQSEAASSSLEDGIGFINTFLMVFAGVALFVGSFIILNTFSMLVAQRTRELALLRALGASRRQVTRSVLLEATLLATIGSTAGLAAGFGLAHGLSALMKQFGLVLDGDLVFSAGTVAWAYAVGVLVTLVAAYLPARRAAKVAPIAAMRDDVVTTTGRPMRRRNVLGAVTAAVATVALAAGLSLDDGDNTGALVGLGSALMLGAAVALSPVLAKPFIRAAGFLLPRVAGRTGHLARENALRNPRRTAATSSALMIGLALVSGFSILGASANASVEALIDDTLKADYVVSTGVGQPFTPKVAEELAAVDGVESVAQERFGAGKFDGTEAMFVAYQPEKLDQALQLDFAEGEVTGLEGNGLLVDQSTAEDEGWQVGDTVEFLVANGNSEELTLGGIYRDSDGLGSVLISMDTYNATGGAQLDRYVYVNLADGVDVAAVRADLEQVTGAYPVVDLKDTGDFKDEQKGQVQQMLTLINALLVLSVLIAVLGVVNTLALSVIERTRELGLLRAVGMSRRQLRRMVRLESVVISIYGAALGLVLGSVFGVSLVQALGDMGINTLQVPAGQLLGFLLLGAVIGVVAATFPARRAGRLKVLDAIAAS
jgi:putative ABC transport system permease protein